MADQKQSELAVAKTQELPAVKLDNAATNQANEKFIEEQERIKQMIAADAPLSEILTKLVLLIESQSPEMICSILQLSDDGNHVKHAVAPSLPENYIKVIDGEPIGPKHGSCGTAMYRGTPVIVSDISTDPLWDEYRNFAWAIGVAACWSTPIMSSKGKVLGSFAMYYREPRTPDGEETHLTTVATKLAAEAIEHNARLRREAAEEDSQT
ncbi:MAG TPA: GAF domain-containing protein [Pyrinomonadaceae bacterium]|nr:GAF domain-containing protein [Pyrinomonadaceae bacterium]